MRFTAIIICCCTALLFSKAAAQAPDLLPDIPTGDVTVFPKLLISGLPVEQEFVTSVFTQRAGPTDLVGVPDGSGRMIVTTYGGTAYLVDRSGNVNTKPFLELNNNSSPSYNRDFDFGWAHGLTTLAFHPDFADNTTAGFGKFYTVEPELDSLTEPDFSESLFLTDRQHHEVLYEYTIDPTKDTCDSICVNSKRELMRVHQPGWHHNVGDLVFDSNNLLYISSGDGSLGRLSENAQVLTNVFGKVLRIDPLGSNSSNGAYGVPIDNPFRDGDGPNVDEIYAYGLRNPYRLDFDAASGELFASETGEETVESVNRIVAGGNHGWNKKEGSFVYDRTSKTITVDEDLNNNGIGDLAESQGYTEPVFQYDRGDGRAVIGGVIHRGTEHPGIHGDYVFADFDGPMYRQGRLFYGKTDTGEPYEFVLAPNSAPLPTDIHSVNKDLEGNLYVLGIYLDEETDTADGVVLKIEPTPLVADFNDDGTVSCQDAAQLHSEIIDGQGSELFDLNGDGSVTAIDMQRFLARAADFQGFANSILPGDADLNGTVNAEDLNIVGNNWLRSSVTSWCDGDFNIDGVVDAHDLNVLGLNWQTDVRSRTLDTPARSVPESNLCVAWLVLCGLALRRMRVA